MAISGAYRPIFGSSKPFIRLEGLSSYVVISALLMNAALHVFSATSKKLDSSSSSKISFGGGNANNTANVNFVVSVIAFVVAGSYATVVFSLLGLYSSKTALGMGLDAAELCAII
jgi:hypothetical protein